MPATEIDQIQVLRLHTAENDLVWFGDDSTLGCNSYLEADDFVEYDSLGFSLDRVRSIRLFGTAKNAALILRLQQIRLNAAGTSVAHLPIMLGSPTICRTDGNLREPEAALHYLWQPESNLSWQWHHLMSSDYCSYSLIDSLQREFGVVSEKARRIAAYHPAWAAVSFIPHCDIEAACRSLAEIVDPRWYVHYTHPHRLSRLLSYLGVTPHNVSAYLGECQPGRHYERAATMIGTWYNRESVQAYNTGKCDAPNDFLWRIFSSQDTVGKGILRATERLVSLIYHVWLYAVSPPHPEVTFEPSLFFKNEAESQAFVIHRDHVRKI